MAYIGQSLVEGTRRVYNYTATASQTTFNAIYQVGVVDVYQNGSLLTPSSYTATDGATIVLNTGATAGDTIAIHCHNTFSVTDTVPASGGAFSGEVTLEDGLIVDSGDVGIGTSSPSALLDIDAGSSTGTHLEITTTGNGHNFDMVDGGATTRIRNVGGVLRIGADHNDEAADSRLQFDVDGSERMRIDSSGNLLVGKTSSSSNVLGVEFRPSGRIFGCVDGNSVSVFNRQTSDGDIVEFRKDNTAVGSIGTSSGDMYLGTGNTILRFHDGDNKIYPAAAGGGSTDGVTDLGFETGKWNTTWTKNLRVQKADIGASFSQFGSVAFEDVDAHIDISSDNSGTWGSSINLREYNTSGTYLNSWSIARHSTGGGTGRLNFNYGTGDNHNITDIQGYLTTDGKLWTNGGIYLGGQSSSNLLDEYEDGTYLPQVVFGGSSSGTGMTSQGGWYTKVGNIVVVHMRWGINSIGGTGFVGVTLPFTVADATATTSLEGSAALGYYGGVTITHTSLLAVAWQGTNEIRFYPRTASTQSGTMTVMDHSDVNTSFDGRATVIYRTA